MNETEKKQVGGAIAVLGLMFLYHEVKIYALHKQLKHQASRTTRHWNWHVDQVVKERFNDIVKNNFEEED